MANDLLFEFYNRTFKTYDYRARESINSFIECKRREAKAAEKMREFRQQVLIDRSLDNMWYE